MFSVAFGEVVRAHCEGETTLDFSNCRLGRHRRRGRRRAVPVRAAEVVREAVAAAPIVEREADVVLPTLRFRVAAGRREPAARRVVTAWF